MRKSLLLLALLLGAGPATAYIGPGAGLSLVGSLFGWLVGLFLTIFAILLWPLRYLFRRLFRRRRAPVAAAPAVDAASEPPAAPDTRP